MGLRQWSRKEYEHCVGTGWDLGDFYIVGREQDAGRAVVNQRGTGQFGASRIQVAHQAEVVHTQQLRL